MLQSELPLVISAKYEMTKELVLDCSSVLSFNFFLSSRFLSIYVDQYKQIELGPFIS